MHIDASDLLALAGVVLLLAGLAWVHPGWLIAALGLGLLSRRSG